MAGAPGTGTAPAPRAGCPAPLRFGGAKGMLAAVGIRPRLFIAIVGPLRGSGPPVAARPPRRLRASPPRSMGGRRLRCARGPLRGWGPRAPLRRRPRPGAGPPRPAKSRRGSSAGGSGRACARLLSVSLPALCPPLRRRGRGNGDSAACGRRDVSIPPTDPSYDQREGCALLWKPSRSLRGFLLRRTLEQGTKDESGVPVVIPGISPCGRRGWGWSGRSRTGIRRL